MKQMIIDVVRRAAKANSGMIEVYVPSTEADAAQKAKDQGYLDVIGNGIFQITAQGRVLVATN